MNTLKCFFWQCNGSADGLIVRVAIVLVVGAVLIVTGLANVLLHLVAWPFANAQATCTRLLRELMKT
jgi:hypothetical protein